MKRKAKTTPKTILGTPSKKSAINKKSDETNYGLKPKKAAKKEKFEKKKIADKEDKKDEVVSPLSESELFGEDYSYIHSYATNFNRQVTKDSKIIDLFEQTSNSELSKLNDAIDKVIDHIKPPEEIYNRSTLELFKKDGEELLKKLDNIKDIYKQISSKLSKTDLYKDEGFKRIMTFRSSEKDYRNGKDKNGEKVRQLKSYTTNKKITEKNKNKYNEGMALPKTAYNNIIKVIEQELPELWDKGTVEGLKKKIENAVKEDSFRKEDIIEWDPVINHYSKKFNLDSSPELISDFNIMCSMLSDVLNECITAASDLEKNKRQNTAIKKLAAIDRIENLITYQYKTASSDMGFVNEVLTGLSLLKKEGVIDVDLSAAMKNTYNATDLGVTLDKTSQQIGISLKHTKDFSKRSNAIKQDALKEKYGDLDKVIGYYKYFILNYTILSNGNWSPEGQGASSAHSPITSFPQLLSAYAVINNSFGKIFLMQNLLGNALLNPNGITSESLPMILVTQDHAVFTYDILKNVKASINGGKKTISMIDITTPFNYKKADFMKLGEAKHNFYLGKTGIFDYSKLLAEGDIKDIMISIHKDSFRGVENNGKRYLSEGSLSFKTTISMADFAALVEKNNLFEIFRR